MNTKRNNIPSGEKISTEGNDIDELKQKISSVILVNFKEQYETILKIFEALSIKRKLNNKKKSEHVVKLKNTAEKMKSILDEIISIKSDSNCNGEKKDNAILKTNYKETEIKKNIDEHLFITEGNKPQFVKIHDIECITAFNEYTNVYLNNSKKVIIRKSLREWEGVLPDTMFIRIHRSTIINFEYVDRVEKFYSRSYVVYLKSINQPFVISQRYLAKLKKKLFF